MSCPVLVSSLRSTLSSRPRSLPKSLSKLSQRWKRIQFRSESGSNCFLCIRWLEAPGAGVDAGPPLGGVEQGDVDHVADGELGHAARQPGGVAGGGEAIQLLSSTCTGATTLQGVKFGVLFSAFVFL